jgi:hypothetical protein
MAQAGFPGRNDGNFCHCEDAVRYQQQKNNEDFKRNCVHRTILLGDNAKRKLTTMSAGRPR